MKTVFPIIEAYRRGHCAILDPGASILDIGLYKKNILTNQEILRRLLLKEGLILGVCDLVHGFTADFAGLHEQDAITAKEILNRREWLGISLHQVLD